jgi:large subunit ribosomal protein L5
MAKPRLVKIVVNVGIGEALTNPKIIDAVSEQLAAITGQKPALRRASKAIAAFKLRLGDPVGLVVTLRGKRMADFFQKLVGIVLPRVRDFSGLSQRSFDNRGNYTLGFCEQIVFPEIEYDKIDRLRGLEVTIVTSANSKAEALEFLKERGMPFKK